jgi:hypothetical protein
LLLLDNNKALHLQYTAVYNTICKSTNKNDRNGEEELVLLATKQWCMVEQGREEAMTKEYRICFNAQEC